MALQQLGALPPVQDITDKLHSGQITVLLMSTGSRGKWKKRFVVVSSSHIYLYDKQSSKGKSKDCGSIDLQDFKSCSAVNNKQLKKKHVIVIQPTDNNNQEWMFSCDDFKSHEKWLHHIDQAIQMQNPLQTRPATIQFEDVTLETELFENHLAKDRPRVQGRRPPTRKNTQEFDVIPRDDVDGAKDDEDIGTNNQDDIASVDDSHYSSGTDEELDKDVEHEKVPITELKPEHFPKRRPTPPLGIPTITSSLAKEAAQKRLGSRKDETEDQPDTSDSNGHAHDEQTNGTSEPDENSDDQLTRAPSLVRRLSNSFIKSFSGTSDQDKKVAKKPPLVAPAKKPKPGLKSDRPTSLFVQGSPKMVSKLPTLHSPVAGRLTSPHQPPIVSPKTPTDVREVIKTLDTLTQTSEKLVIKAKALRNAIKDLDIKQKDLSNMHGIERMAKFALNDIEDAIIQLTKADSELNK